MEKIQLYLKFHNLFVHQKSKIFYFFFFFLIFMQKNNEFNEPSLYLAYNSNSDKLPTDFRFTSYLVLKPKGMFADFLDDDKFIIACGTFEGAILIIGKKSSTNNKNKIFKKISLLCGHESSVCSMIQTLQENYFLSISTDGMICCWSLFDFSCIFKTNVFHVQGDYKFILSWVYQYKVWIISTGLFFCLFDLRLQAILKKVQIPGILSFSVLSPTKLSYINKFIAVAQTIDKMSIFNIDLKSLSFHLSNAIIFPKGKLSLNYFLSEYGTIRIDKISNKWNIINVLTFKSLLEYQFDLDEDDKISDIEWKSQETIVFSTFKGLFFIVHISINENKKTTPTEYFYLVKSVQSVNTNLYCNKFIFNDFIFTNDELKIVFCPDSKSILLLTPKKDNPNEYVKSIFKANQRKRNISFPVNSFHPEFLTLKSSKEVVLLNGSTGVEVDSFKFDKEVTSIYFGSDTKSSHMIVVAGHKNGSVSFFDKTTRRIANIEALPDEIIAFTHLPIKKNNHNVFLAISYNSACLIQQAKVDTFFLLNQYQIISVLFFNEHIIFKHINGLIEAFSMHSNVPIFLQEVPKKAKCLWSYFNKDSMIKKKCSDISDSMNIFLSINPKKDKSLGSLILKNIGYNSFCYHFYNISNMIKNNTSPEVAEILEYVKIICNLKFNQNCSYVLIGSDSNSQTFFYPGFSAFSENIINASDQITASHFLINVMFKIVFKFTIDNSIELKKDYVRCLPLFINFLILTEDQVIKKFLSSVCIDLSSDMTFVKCQNLAELLTVDNDRVIEKTMSNYLSLSFVAAKHPECIKHDLMHSLLHFLLNLSESESIESELALFLLIDGKSKAWLKIFGEYDQLSSENEKKAFYHKIIVSICKNRKMNFLLTKFCIDVYNDIQAYCDTLVDILNMNEETCDVKKILSMYARVVTQNATRPINEEHQNFDAMDIIVTMANFWNNSKIGEVIDGIFSNFSMFHNFSLKNSVMAVGKNDGEVCIFSKGKKGVSDKPFLSKVNFVSISPNGGFCVAVSDTQKKFALYQIKCNLLKKMALVCVENGDTEFCVNMIKWTAEDKWTPVYS